MHSSSLHTVERVLWTAGAQDGYLIVEDGAAINEIALCSSAENEFVSGAAGDIYGEYDHTFSGSGDGAVLEGHNIVTTLTSSTSSSLVNVVVLSRFALHCTVFIWSDLLFQGPAI